jgi:hypothetical protein
VNKPFPFFLTPRAQRRTYFASRNQTPKYFAPAGATQGAAPRPCALFGKKVDQKLSSFFRRNKKNG